MNEKRSNFWNYFELKKSSRKITTILLCFFTFGMQAQDSDPFRTRISLSATQLNGDKTELTAKVLTRINKKYQPLRDSEIQFFTINEDGDVSLGSANTNSKGFAKIEIDDLSKFSTDDESYVQFAAEYAGNDQYKPSSDEVALKEIEFEIEASELDSVKTISINLFDTSDSAAILEDFMAQVMVPRLFSDLVVAEEYTDEEGHVEFDFPNDLLGDEQGNLPIVVRIEDTDDYGTIEARINKNWGLKKVVDEAASRQLWTPDAPLWMVLTFLFMMAAVWGHFIIIILKLLNLKKMGLASVNQEKE